MNDCITTGLKSNIFGYISSGDNVPDVMTTLWKRLNIGCIAIDESRQLKFSTGFDTVGVLSSNGSTMTVKPFVYVDISVAKWVICRQVNVLRHCDRIESFMHWELYHGFLLISPEWDFRSRWGLSFPMYAAAMPSVRHKNAVLCAQCTPLIGYLWESRRANLALRAAHAIVFWCIR